MRQLCSTPRTIRWWTMGPARAALGGAAYSYFRYQQHLTQEHALAVHQDIAADFATHFGRHYGLVELFQLEDAEYVLVMSNAFATKGKAAVQRFRARGLRAGLLRLRVLRPFPAQAIAAALDGRKAVAVIDQNLAPGLGGITYQEIAAALYASAQRPPLLSVIGGLGGKTCPRQSSRPSMGTSSVSPGVPQCGTLGACIRSPSRSACRPCYTSPGRRWLDAGERRAEEEDYPGTAPACCAGTSTTDYGGGRYHQPGHAGGSGSARAGCTAGPSATALGCGGGPLRYMFCPRPLPRCRWDWSCPGGTSC
jgi:hypothetical protein